MTRYDPLPRSMGREAFMAKFGGVYERFPEIADSAWQRGLTPETDTPAGLADAMAAVAASLDEREKLRLIRNHPDLAGRLGMADLTRESRSEQSAAGLDQCTPEEFRRFRALNDAYRAKFAFPFILAVSGRSRSEILAAFEARLGNDRDGEFRTALAEIDRIASIRLHALAP